MAAVAMEIEQDRSAAATEAVDVLAGEEAEETSAEAAATCEFRWDVEVQLGDRRLGEKFMKQWRRVLQAQKLAPLVSPKLSPQHARFQLCCIDGDVGSPQVSVREAAIAEVLARLRWPAGGAPERCIEGEPAGTHPAGWQGVRVWMTFARQDVEAVLSKKPKMP